jgi:flagellar motor protein MotB
MAEYDGLTPGQVLADASVAEFIKSLGLSIAEAQQALDENSVNQIAEFIVPREGLGGKTLMDLGLSPAFYHYQYADLSCSLQLNLKVEKDFSLGLNLNGSFKDTTTSSSDNSSSSSSTESGSSTRTETREARVEITSASAGALNVGGTSFQLTGDTPEERISNLQDALTGDPATGVAGVLYQLQPTSLTIESNAPEEKVQVTKNTVAFLSGGFDSGIIRIGTNTNTSYTLDSAPAVTVATTAKSSIAAYADHVKSEVESKGYSTKLVAPTAAVITAFFVTGKHKFSREEEDEIASNLMRFALAMKQMNLSVEIEGFADRQPFTSDSSAKNLELSINRAKELERLLIANGMPASKVKLKESRGETVAAEAGDSEGQDNQRFRKAEVTVVDRAHHWLFVHAPSGSVNLDSVAPDMVGDTSADNGFIYLYKPTTLGLSSKKVTIEGTDFSFSGAAISGGAKAGSPQAYAQNLAKDINGHASAALKASVVSNVVTVSKDGDKFQLTLVTAEQRQISLTGSSGVTVKQEFTRTRSTSQTQQNTGNRAVAVGASLDVRFSRKFEMNVTGNSSISARLVSIPAPPQFLETIQEFLKQGE